MKLSELISIVGDDNVTFQTLATDMKSANVNIAKGVGQVTFKTSPQMVMDILRSEPEFIGLVVWIPKSLVPETAVSEEES